MSRLQGCELLKIVLATLAIFMQLLRMTNELTAKMTGMGIEELGEIVARMFNDTRAEAGFVLEAALSVLETKMSEADFVRFCDKIAA